MKRVLVLGSAGSGKSTFARRLADLTDLPVIHLDQYYWQPGWIGSEHRPWILKISELTATPEWIMDGNYSSTLAQRLEYADTVVFLDISRWRCLFRVLWRTTIGYGRTRDDMPTGCPERFDIPFLKYIWHFPKEYRAGLVDVLKNFGRQVVIIKNSAEAENFFLKMQEKLP